jgi:hypothetical protein
MLYRSTQTLYYSPSGDEVPGTDDLLWCRRLGSLTGRIFHGETRPHRVGGALSCVRAIMTIIRVRVVELLCQAMMGRIPVPKCLVLGAPG